MIAIVLAVRVEADEEQIALLDPVNQRPRPADAQALLAGLHVHREQDARCEQEFLQVVRLAREDLVHEIVEDMLVAAFEPIGKVERTGRVIFKQAERQLQPRAPALGSGDQLGRHLAGQVWPFLCQPVFVFFGREAQLLGRHLKQPPLGPPARHRQRWHAPRGQHDAHRGGAALYQGSCQLVNGHVGDHVVIVEYQQPGRGGHRSQMIEEYRQRTLGWKRARFGQEGANFAAMLGQHLANAAGQVRHEYGRVVVHIIKLIPQQRPVQRARGIGHEHRLAIAGRRNQRHNLVTQMVGNQLIQVWPRDAGRGNSGDKEFGLLQDHRRMPGC